MAQVVLKPPSCAGGGNVEVVPAVREVCDPHPSNFKWKHFKSLSIQPGLGGRLQGELSKEV